MSITSIIVFLVFPICCITFFLLYFRYSINKIDKVRQSYVEEIKSLQRILEKSLDIFNKKMENLIGWVMTELPGDVNKLFFASHESKVLRSKLKLSEERYFELLTPMVENVQKEITFYVNQKINEIKQEQINVIKESMNERA